MGGMAWRHGVETSAVMEADARTSDREEGELESDVDEKEPVKGVEEVEDGSDVDEAAWIEARRKKRRMIAEKHRHDTRANAREATVERTEEIHVEEEKSKEKPKPRETKVQDELDMFSDSPADKDVDGVGVAHATTGLRDSWDDVEGYYIFQVGEVLDQRYKVTSAHGKGVFSTVLRAIDLEAEPRGIQTSEVAIKVIRANEVMLKAGRQEQEILQTLAKYDPNNQKFCIRMTDSFEYRNHLCLVFEPMALNLREVLKKYGRGIGISIRAVQVYATQFFVALQHLKFCNIIHADIKPDNILANDEKNPTVVKICDLGSAMTRGENELTPYLASRFYRAPEVILGMRYDVPMDMWSVGCCLFELYTGRILFPGRTNNEMLKYMMDYKGPFSKKMLRRGIFSSRHFDDSGAFGLLEEDKVSGQQVRKILHVMKASKNLTRALQSSTLRPDPATKRKVNQLGDLLEKIFVLDPEKRITVDEALAHPFIREPLQS